MDRSAQYIASLLAAAHSAKAAGFIPLESDEALKALAERAFFASTYGLKKFNSPYSPPAPFPNDYYPWTPALAARHSYHVASANTWDFLCHELRMRELDVVVVEGVNDVLIELPELGAPLLNMTPGQQAAEIARVASLLLSERWKHVAWIARSSSGETADIAYTTYPRAYPGRSGAWRRMDAGVRGETLFFIFYKRRFDGKDLDRNSRTYERDAWFKHLAKP